MRYIYTDRDNEIHIDDDFGNFDRKNCHYVMHAAKLTYKILAYRSMVNMHYVILIKGGIPTLARLALAAALGSDRTHIALDVRRVLKNAGLPLLATPHKWKHRKPDIVCRCSTPSLRVNKYRCNCIRKFQPIDLF